MTEVATHLLVVEVEVTSREANHGFVPWLGAALVDIKQEHVVESWSSFARAPPGHDEWGATCLEGFWATPENKPNYERVLAALSNPATPSHHEAGDAFLAWVDTLCTRYGRDALILTVNTSYFDGHHLTSLLRPGARSLLYLFGEYRPLFNVSAFYAGVARVSPAKERWVGYSDALRALGLAPPKLHVVHDHDPVNDASHIGLRAAYVLNRLGGAAPGSEAGSERTRP